MSDDDFDMDYFREEIMSFLQEEFEPIEKLPQCPNCGSLWEEEKREDFGGITETSLSYVYCGNCNLQAAVLVENELYQKRDRARKRIREELQEKKQISMF